MRKTISAIVRECFAFLRRPYLQYQKKQKAQQELLQKHLRIRYYRKQRLAQNSLKKHWWKFGICLFLYLPAWGQQGIKPLKIGDEIVSLTISPIIHGQSPSLNLKEAQGKVVILDFWSIYCGSCLQHLPLIQKLNSQFKDSLLILPVTSEPREKVLQAMERNPILRNTYFQTAVEDKKLKQLFPHDLVPHLVWIDRQGKYIGATLIEYLTPANIRQVWQGKIPHWEIKTDKNLIDLKKTSLHDYYQQDTSNYFFPYLAGVNSQSGTVLMPDSSIRFYMVNTSMARQYAVATSFQGLPLEPKRREINLKDALAYEYQPSAGYQADWAKVYSYSYERIFSKGTSITQLHQLLLKDLNTHFHLTGQIIKESKAVWVLQKNTSLAPSEMENEGSMRLSDWLAEVNRVPNLKWIIDESGLSPNTLLPALPKNITYETLNQSLSAKGWSLNATQRRIPVFILKPNPQP